MPSLHAFRWPWVAKVLQAPNTRTAPRMHPHHKSHLEAAAANRRPVPALWPPCTARTHSAHTQRTPVRRILGCRGPPGQQEKGLPPNVHVLLCKRAYTQKITLKQKQQIAHSHPDQDLLPDQVPGCSSNQCLREYQSQPGGSQHTSRRFASEGIVPTGKLGLEIRQTFSLKGLLLGSSISLLFQAAGLWLQLQSRLMHSVHPDGLPQHMWAGFRPAEPSPGPHLHSPQGGGAPSSTPTPPHTQAADAN